MQTIYLLKLALLFM